MNRSLFLIAYDVRNPRRLRRVHQVLKDFASGGQKSVFECYLTQVERKELLQRVAQEMDADEDALLLIRLSAVEAVELLGKAVKPMDETYTYLG
jgi:CRISPR-associated protein Cas2